MICNLNLDSIHNWQNECTSKIQVNVSIINSNLIQIKYCNVIWLYCREPINIKDCKALNIPSKLPGSVDKIYVSPGIRDPGSIPCRLSAVGKLSGSCSESGALSLASDAQQIDSQSLRRINVVLVVVHFTALCIYYNIIDHLISMISGWVDDLSWQNWAQN